MADVYSSYDQGMRGTPAFEALDTYITANLLCSANPPQEPTVRILLGDSLDLAQFTVVGLSSGKLVAAVSGSVTPIGVLAFAAESGAANTTKFGEVHLTGDYNIDADSPLVWDASFDTEAKKTFAPVANTGGRLMFRSRTASGAPKP